MLHKLKFKGYKAIRVHKNIKCSELELPWEIIVDSKATTACPHDKASETSGETFTNPSPIYKAKSDTLKKGFFFFLKEKDKFQTIHQLS